MEVNYINKKLVNIYNNKDIPPVFRDYIKLTVIGMIMYYGDEYADLILDSINDIDFYYGIDSLIKDSTFDTKQVEAWINNAEPAFTLHSFTRFSKNSKQLPVIDVKYGICVRDNITVNNIVFLEYIVHEINHIVCSKNNSFFKDEDNNIGYRTGFFTAYFKSKDKKNGKGRIFNEVINSLMTEDIINIILNIQDQELDSFIDSLRKSTTEDQYYVQGYLGLTNLFRTLFNIEEFKNFSKRCLIDGNVEDMDELFNAVLRNNKFDELLDKLDSYYKDYLLAYKSKNHCTLFNISTQYIDIKDNYVGLFLEKKYQRKLAFK